MKYLIVIEKTNTGFSAYTSDIDGCVATGKTKKKEIKGVGGNFVKGTNLRLTFL